MLGKLSGRRAAEPPANGEKPVDPAKLAAQLDAVLVENQRLKALVTACLPACIVTRRNTSTGRSSGVVERAVPGLRRLEPRPECLSVWCHCR